MIKIYISYTLQVVALGAILIGFITGILSIFFISRRQSILGDAISHSTLAGITLVFYILREQIQLGLLVGALASGILAVLLISVITSQTKIKSDAAIGIVLSLFFGIGIVMLSLIQKSPAIAQTSLKHYLFGNIALLRYSDLPSILFLGVVVLGLIAIFWKELKLISFDTEYAKTLGLHVRRYENLVLVLVVITIVIGVELIGVVMMAGLLIGPGIAARQWSQTFGRVVLLSGFLGSTAGLLGTIASATITDLPAGPTIIVITGIIVGISIIFSRDGLIWEKLKFYRYRLQYDVEESLEHLATHMLMDPRACDIREFDVREEHDGREQIAEKNHQLQDDLEVLIQLGYVKPRETGNWILTHRGMELVQEMREKIPLPQGGREW